MSDVASFASDNHAGVDPAVMSALADANTGSAGAYGDDPWTERLLQRMGELFERPVGVLPCWGGTGANVVGLATMLDPWQAVVTVDSAHIVVDECGAPTRFTGSTVISVPGVAGKLVPEAVEPYLSWRGVEHHPQPRVLSISQVTEMGTIYSVDEIVALGELARSHGLLLHVDGARIANAVAATGTSLQSMLTDTGVDVLTFGMTKNGAMYGEVVVLLDPTMASKARYIRKQAGQLPSKSRFVAAQCLALLEDGRWIGNAERANSAALRLWEAVRDLPGIGLDAPPEANSIFPTLTATQAAAIGKISPFWPWDQTRDLWRWMTSFETTAADVDTFASGVRAAFGE